MVAPGKYSPAPDGSRGPERNYTSGFDLALPILSFMDLSTMLLSGLVVAVGLALTAVHVRHRREVFSRIQELSESFATPVERLEIVEELVQAAREDQDALEEITSRFDEWRGNIIVAVDDGIREVKRREDRINATVRRARKELAEVGYEHPGIEAEAAELQLIDGGGGGEVGVPPVYEDVAEASQGPEPSSVPGVTAEQLRRARGF